METPFSYKVKHDILVLWTINERGRKGEINMFKLPNGKPLDEEMVEMAMEDASAEYEYYLNMQSGEVVSFSMFDDSLDEGEIQGEDINDSSVYTLIQRIPSKEAYRWMEDFVAEIVAPKNESVAEELSNALSGKGAFRRFKVILQRVGEEWSQVWYQWRDAHLKEAMREWFASLPIKITEE